MGMGEHDAGPEDSQSKGSLCRTTERQLWKPEQVTLVPCLGHAWTLKPGERKPSILHFRRVGEELDYRQETHAHTHTPYCPLQLPRLEPSQEKEVGWLAHSADNWCVICSSMSHPTACTLRMLQRGAWREPSLRS